MVLLVWLRYASTHVFPHPCAVRRVRCGIVRAGSSEGGEETGDENRGSEPACCAAASSAATLHVMGLHQQGLRLLRLERVYANPEVDEPTKAKSRVEARSEEQQMLTHVNAIPGVVVRGKGLIPDEALELLMSAYMEWPIKFAKYYRAETLRNHMEVLQELGDILAS